MIYELGQSQNSIKGGERMEEKGRMDKARHAGRLRRGRVAKVRF